MNGKWWNGRLLGLTLCVALTSVSAVAQSPAAAGERRDEKTILTYIAHGWDTLSRSMSECASVADIKVTTVPVLYLPADMEVPAEVVAMQKQCHVDVRRLPRVIHHINEVRTEELPANGLLYLPNRYVVPGGRFNEMYGWDSYFILLGLVHDHRMELARGMVENFFFEIEHYGAVLNANRTYFFTRSQPPFLTSMIREIYEHPSAGAPIDKPWLAHAYAMASRDYQLWTSAAHSAGSTGLARYHDLGAGPVPEMADDSSYYPDVIKWLLAHPDRDPQYLVDGPVNPTAAQTVELAKSSCDVKLSRVCAQAVVEGHRLSASYFRSDRAMRESGFDTTFRFGSFAGSTSDYAPVCLNSLLFKYENDMAHFADLLGKPEDAKLWLRRAATRRKAIDRYLWDGASGMYFDYDFVTQKRSTYKYISTFYPLWAGAASPQQAAAVRASLATLEHGGGISMSDVSSGVQWDAPYGWAPTTWLAVDGLNRAGFHEDASRVAREFSKTVLDNFEHDGTMREKYNIVDGSANVKVAAGYKSNVVGFGWTNGVYMMLQDVIGAEPPTLTSSK